MVVTRYSVVAHGMDSIGCGHIPTTPCNPSSNESSRYENLRFVCGGLPSPERCPPPTACRQRESRRHVIAGLLVAVPLAQARVPLVIILDEGRNERCYQQGSAGFLDTERSVLKALLECPNVKDSVGPPRDPAVNVTGIFNCVLQQGQTKTVTNNGGWYFPIGF